MRTAWAGPWEGSRRLAGALRGTAHSPQYFAVGAFWNPHFTQCLLKGTAHSLQNFIPSGFSAPQFEQRIFPSGRHSISHLVKQCLGVFQVGGVEAFGQPVVDLGQHRASLVAFALLREQPRETSSLRAVRTISCSDCAQSQSPAESSFELPQRLALGGTKWSRANESARCAYQIGPASAAAFQPMRLILVMTDFMFICGGQRFRQST